jgi:alpha-galactosidase
VAPFSSTENRAHLSMWAVMASPLIAGNDIRSMPAGVRAVLTDPDVLAINRDAAGRQAQRPRPATPSPTCGPTACGGRRVRSARSWVDEELVKQP